jgi:hypothetical protein
VLSDAGSTPAASTTFDVFAQHSSRFFVPFPPPPLFLHILGAIVTSFCHAIPSNLHFRAVFFDVIEMGRGQQVEALSRFPAASKRERPTSTSGP